MKTFFRSILLSAFAFSAIPSSSQTPTIGLIQYGPGGQDDGYVLFTPMSDTTTYLIDKCGKKIHTWSSNYLPGTSVYLLPNGTLLRPADVNNPIFNAGGTGGGVEEFDWNGNLTWSYMVSDSFHCQHHDVRVLPNGNILVIAWEKKTHAQAVAAGRNPTFLGPSLWMEEILELQPVGNNSAITVWQWHLWDHLVQHYDSTRANYGVIANNPRLVNLNYGATAAADWVHMNSIDYDPIHDQILVSSHNLNEIWVIDHSTTTAQAASHSGGTYGHGGDLLWRWGNPAAYNHGTVNEKKLFGQHNAHWIEPGLPHAGDIMVFNNGLNRPAGNYSSIEIIVPPINGSGQFDSTLPYLPSGSLYTYTDSIPTNFYSWNISGAEELRNGNILICDGQGGTFFEVDTSGHTVWKYISPIAGGVVQSQGSSPGINLVFRSPFYYADYSGFNSQTLVPGAPIELNPYPSTCNLMTGQQELTENDPLLYPVPAHNTVHINSPDHVQLLRLMDVSGRVVLSEQPSSASFDVDISELRPGVYIVDMQDENGQVMRKKLLVN